jgi:predicted Zn-dependent peptidase
VLGEAEVIADTPVPKIADYHRGRYVADSLVVGAAGHLRHDDIVALAERFVKAPEGSVPVVNGGAPKREPRVCFNRKDTEQYHICFGAPGIARDDERRFALAVIDSAFGGSVSSRLFREVREKRGLAYAVGSYAEQYIDRGSVATYVGTRKENVAEACEIIGREMASLSGEGVRGDELERAKEHVKGRMVLGMESTGARMSRISRATLFGLEIYSLDEMIAKVDSVSEDDVSALAAELYDPNGFNAACIGKDEAVFTDAVGAVSESLSA